MDKKDFHPEIWKAAIKSAMLTDYGYYPYLVDSLVRAMEAAWEELIDRKEAAKFCSFLIKNFFHHHPVEKPGEFDSVH